METSFEHERERVDRIGEWPESEGEDEFQVDEIYPWSRFNFNFFDCTRREEVCTGSSKCLKRLFAERNEATKIVRYSKRKKKKKKTCRVSFFVLWNLSSKIDPSIISRVLSRAINN